MPREDDPDGKEQHVGEFAPTPASLGPRYTFTDGEQFGAGARTCIGKNISLLEMAKVIPQIYREFDFRLADAALEWELETVWFVKQRYTCVVDRRTR